jgi:hypothetical protein
MSDNCFMDEKPPFAEAVNTISIEFLLNDLDLAMTLLDVASTTIVDETAKRNHQNAHKAYDVVVCHLSKVKLNASQEHELDEKLAALKARLESVGQKF